MTMLQFPMKNYETICWIYKLQANDELPFSAVLLSRLLFHITCCTYLVLFGFVSVNCRFTTYQDAHRVGQSLCYVEGSRDGVYKSSSVCVLRFMNFHIKHLIACNVRVYLTLQYRLGIRNISPNSLVSCMI